MDHRYLVTYNRWDGKTVQATTAALGRFWDLAAAERHANEQYGVSGCEVVSVRPETAFEANRHKVYRVVVRFARVACAAVAGFIAYAWLHDSGVDTGDVPLASLTGNMIFSNLMHVGLAIGAVWFCWILAFGAGPDK